MWGIKRVLLGFRGFLCSYGFQGFKVRDSSQFTGCLRCGITYYTHIPPLVHCASSNMSRLEWMMNWFMYCAVSG